MRLVGRQHAVATQLQPRSERAAVCLQIGSTQLYLWKPETVRHLHNTWNELRHRRRALPYRSSTDLIWASGTMSEPGVILHAKDEPPASALLVPGKGNQAAPWLLIQFDRVAFEIRDQEAFASTAHAVDHAAELAHDTFLEPVALPPPRLGLLLA